MAKLKQKSDLAQKVCEQCNKPFTWRKKWEKVWHEVKYCSERCRIEKRKKKDIINLTCQKCST
jgi:hypothetical protein